MCKNVFPHKSLYINQLEILYYVVVKQEVEAIHRSYLYFLPNDGILQMSNLIAFAAYYLKPAN